MTDIFKYMNRESPVSVILGAPGSGKSTTLRWLSLHMARAALSSAYQFPRGDDADDDFEESEAPPDGFDWQLDDILFETLQAMAEQAR